MKKSTYLLVILLLVIGVYAYASSRGPANGTRGEIAAMIEWIGVVGETGLSPPASQIDKIQISSAFAVALPVPDWDLICIAITAGETTHDGHQSQAAGSTTGSINGASAGTDRASSCYGRNARDCVIAGMFPSFV